MPSTNTYTQTIPYFYIIRHIESGKLYAGAKWATGCHPITFMIPDGYTTSSSIINAIIKSEGLAAFEILRIDTNLDGVSAYEYETLFLQTLNCANLDNWINEHNNDNILSFGTIKYKTQLTIKYGVEHPTHINDHFEKTKKTNLERYGYEYGLQSELIRNKGKQTKLTRYGNENYCNPEKATITAYEKYGNRYNKQKWQETMFLLYGVSHNSKLPEHQIKVKNTKLERYGDENYCNHKQMHQTKSEKYGNPNYNNREKSKITCLEQYNVEHVSQTKWFRDKVAKTFLQNRLNRLNVQTIEELFSIIDPIIEKNMLFKQNGGIFFSRILKFTPEYNKNQLVLIRKLYKKYSKYYNN